MKIVHDQVLFSRFLAGIFGLFYIAFSFCLPLIMSGVRQTYWSNLLLLSLIGTVAGSCGWLVGILMTPLQNQAAAAGKVAAAISIIWTTALAINFRNIAHKAFSIVEAGVSTTHKIQLLFAFGIFVLGITVTFNTRIDGVDATSNSTISNGDTPQSTKALTPP
jgi:uncharacterized SAM-binding protein YcdF (DUF218 family)